MIVPPLSPPASNPPGPARHVRRAAVAFVAAGLVAVGVAAGSLWTALAMHTVGRGAAATGALASAPASLATVYQQAIAGVVTVSTEQGLGNPRRFAEGTGAGFVVDKQGHILTNAHVVAGAREVRVTFHDGDTVTARVSGVDPGDDLAIVQVSVGADKLHPLRLGNSDGVQVGEPALAIGSPFGLSGTLTAGIVSGLGRSRSAPNGRALAGMIQTDAAINPGNSGGPLLNQSGEVIGIDESIESPVEGSVGIGFAIPINAAKRVLSDLERGQVVQHAWLGIQGETLTPTRAAALGLQQASGVLVIDVRQGGPAQRAGLHATGTPSAGDDVITAVDDHPAATIEALTSYLDLRHVGERVTLAVVREGRHLSIDLTLGVFPASTS